MSNFRLSGRRYASFRPAGRPVVKCDAVGRATADGRGGYPIAITHRGRRRHVLMSIDEFERLEKAATARAYRLAELPNDLADELATAEMDARHNHLDKLLD
ncbi:type II toxin-antitoxin system prevent-host-death family antitoxin [Bradyrhizobium sp.]|uniref:type II toxin-antitoxin system prevent-host-death family antitoxin n=1 Tax=Bradyrhizobium sp. TaxID=376 RepID=UPI003C263289